MLTWERHRVYRCLEKRPISRILPSEMGAGAGVIALLALLSVQAFWVLGLGILTTTALACLRRADGGRRNSLALWVRCWWPGPRCYNACVVWEDPARNKPWREGRRR